MPPRGAALRGATAMASVALVWAVLFRINEAMFPATAHSPLANWIFLPASVRLLAVLLLGELGALGLTLGALLTAHVQSAGDWPFSIGLAVSSGLAPLLSVSLCRRLLRIEPDLAGLKAGDIAVLSLACAFANAALLNAYLFVTGRFHGDFGQMLAVFVGDTAGAAIVLFLASLMLVLVLPRPR